MSPADRKKCGDAGREWATSSEAGFTAQHMADRAYEMMERVLSVWTSPKRFHLYNTEQEVIKNKNKKSGVSIKL